MPELFLIGRNDGGHIAELRNKRPSRPVVFNKAYRCLSQGRELEYVLEKNIGEIHFESELVLIVGKKLVQGQPAKLEEHLRGWTLGLDLTARDLQTELKEQGLPWFRAKSRRNFAYVGPELSSRLVPDWKSFEFEMHLNGALQQHGQVRKLLFSLEECLEACAEVLDLEAGDFVFTGTPAGVGPLNHGDKLELGAQEHGKILTLQVL
jgi:2-keto-4-pentenoate hydratase/2-oxohepta-3-ene-1,7-dioic acid hydratase in catechol pathway